MRVHLIAIGGSAMHNMALALHEKGFKVTGSDDEINEPSKTRLKNACILPEEIGWFPEKLKLQINAMKETGCKLSSTDGLMGNGIYDLKDGKFRDGRPEDKISIVLFSNSF
jgi:hypothetical protein